MWVDAAGGNSDWIVFRTRSLMSKVLREIRRDPVAAERNGKERC